MSERVVLEEILENEVHKAFSQKVAEEYDLEMRLADSTMGYIHINKEEIREKLRLTTLERIELQEKWLRLKVKSTKARRDFQAKNDPKFNILEQLSPNFNKAVWEAEDELNRHLKKYGKE